MAIFSISYKRLQDSSANNGKGDFTLSKEVFKNFNQDGSDNYYTVELFDIDGDGWLDLFLGGQEKLRIIPNKNGVFDRANAKMVQSEKGLELMDIAFMDFDLDGKLDILTMSNKSGYNGYGLRLFLNKGNEFVDATSNYFDIAKGKNGGIDSIILPIQGYGLWGVMYGSLS